MFYTINKSRIDLVIKIPIKSLVQLIFKSYFMTKIT